MVHTNIFKAHSTRTASTSAVKVQGVSTVDIMKATNWTRESIFTRFYYKPVNLGASVWNYHPVVIL